MTVIAYLFLLALLVVFQRQLTFPGSCFPVAAARLQPPNGSTPLTLHTEDGSQIGALFCRAFEASGQPTDHPADHPTIIYFYGNGQVLNYSLFEIDLFRRCGANVLAADYVGFGLSPGTPSERGCYQTATALWDYAASSPNVDPSRIVAFGYSLGGAMAIDLAQRRPVAGLMTLSTFTRLNDAARRRFWFVPTALLLRSNFPSVDKIRDIRCPTVIAHGDADTIVPYRLHEGLMNASPAGYLKHLRIPGAGHNDAFPTGYVEIQQALTELLSVVNAGHDFALARPAVAPAGK